MSVLLINEVAELLKVSPSSISRWCEEARKGTSRFPLPISVKGGNRRWLRSDIEQYLAEQSTATQKPTTGVPTFVLKKCKYLAKTGIFVRL